MSVITILKDFAFAGQLGDPWKTDWIRFPAGWQDAQFAVDIKTREAVSTLDLVLETSWDTDSIVQVPATFMTTGAPGTTVVDITSGLGPLVQLALAASSLGSSEKSY